jgi:4,5-dihydroxyphthalate decarboxylase
MAKPFYSTVTRTQGHNMALKTGAVTPRSFSFNFVETHGVADGFRMMVRAQPFDICELPMTTYVCARAFGAPFTAIPVFPARGFHAGAIFVKRHGGFSVPKDLQGQRVGLDRGYTVTTSVWARAYLSRNHGVDLSTITWVRAGEEHVSAFVPPANVVACPPGRTLAQMLVEGEIAAAIGIEANHPDIVQLLPDAAETCLRQLHAGGVYPTNHVIVIRDALIAAHPGLASDVFHTFAEAKRRHVADLRNNAIAVPDAPDRLYRRVMQVFDDPLPYGLAANRFVLEMLIENLVSQRIIDTPVSLESLFVPETLALKG